MKHRFQGRKERGSKAALLYLCSSVLICGIGLLPFPCGMGSGIGGTVPCSVPRLFGGEIVLCETEKPGGVFGPRPVNFISAFCEACDALSSFKFPAQHFDA